MEFYEYDLNQLVFHRISGSFKWMLPLIQIQIGDSDAVKPSVRTILLDTGTTEIYLPSGDFVRIITNFCDQVQKQRMRCSYIEPEIYISQCKPELMPDVKIQIDRYVYTLPGKELVEMVLQFRQQCRLRIVEDASNKHNTYLFGAAFLTSYY